MTTVNPARAGMILVYLTRHTHTSSKPRASGDDPSDTLVLLNQNP